MPADILLLFYALLDVISVYYAFQNNISINIKIPSKTPRLVCLKMVRYLSIIGFPRIDYR